MICKKEIIFFLGRKDNNDGLIIMYKNETFEYAPLNMKFGFDASIVVVDNYVYVFGNGNTSGEKKLIITRINLEKRTKKNIGILYPIKTSLNVFYNNEIFLFGGKSQQKNRKCYEFDEDCIEDTNNLLKVLNHKNLNFKKQD